MSDTFLESRLKAEEDIQEVLSAKSRLRLIDPYNSLLNMVIIDENGMHYTEKFKEVYKEFKEEMLHKYLRDLDKYSRNSGSSDLPYF